jgi:hypothetical protein
MATLNDRSVQDGNTYVLAVYYNKLLGNIFRKDFSNAVVMTTDLVLTDGDMPIQRLDCNGANRVVSVPPGADGNHPFLLINVTSSGSWTLTVKSNDGVDTLKVLNPGDHGFFTSDGNGAYMDLIAFDGSAYLAKTGLTEWDEQGSDPSTPASGKWKVYFKSDGLYIVDDAGTVVGPLGPKRVAIDGMQLIWNSVNSLSIGTGSCFAENGDFIDITSPLTASSLSLSNSTWYHLYVYLNSGAPAMEVVTTAPVAWKGTAYSKTGDTSRRYVGSVKTDGSGNIYQFRHAPESGDIFYVDVAAASSPFAATGLTATSATAIDFSAVVPVTGIIVKTRMFNGTNQVLYIGSSNSVSSTVYAWGILNGFPVQLPGEIVCDSSQRIWYLHGAAVTGTSVAAVLGYKFRR